MEFLLISYLLLKMIIHVVVVENTVNQGLDGGWELSPPPPSSHWLAENQASAMQNLPLIGYGRYLSNTLFVIQLFSRVIALSHFYFGYPLSAR